MNDFKKKLKSWLSFVLVLWFLTSRYGIEELPMRLLGIDVEEKKEQEKEEHPHHYICECDRMRREDNEDDERSHRGQE